MPNRPAARPLRALLRAGLLAVAATAGAGALAAGPAAAEGCPGSGTSGCPYAAAQTIGQRAEGVLRFPEAVAVDAGGDVYVADQLSYVVQKFSAAGAFETQWGSYGGGHGQFGPIGGLATDAAGDVYVVDSSHNRIQKFDANGSFISSWGGRGEEVGRFNFGSSQNYTDPPGGGIAVAGNYVYVADSGNNRVERFNLQGGEAMAWGTRGGGLGQFNYPRGVAANEGEVIVSDDDNHRIEKFAPEGAFEAAVGANGTGPGQFGFPYGVALDAAGDVYVGDDINHRIDKLTPQLTFAGAWGGFGSKPGQLAFPRALASDALGDTYVADTANDRIEVFDPVGNYLRTFGISARGAGQLTAPRGLAADPTGRLFVPDASDSRIELFAPGGDSFAGQWTLAGGHAPTFSEPGGVGIDARGSLYVADEGNARLVHLWGDGTYLGEIGGPADVGGAQLSGADSVAVSPVTGATYVADSAHNRVLAYGPEGTLLSKWGAGEGDSAAGSGAGEFSHPDAVAVDPGGEVYVADTANDRIVKLSSTGGVLAQWGGRGTADGRFHAPAGVTVDAAGEVFVLDSENNRVEVFSAGGQFLARWGARGDGPGYLSQPRAITLDCSGAVYVADTNNNRIERFAGVAAAPAGCLAAGTWPPPLDVAPVLRVRVARSSGVLARGGLALAVSCQRSCRIHASATLSARGARRAVALTGAARTLPAALTGHLRLRVRPAALRLLRAQLGRRRALRGHVLVVAVGPTGRRTSVTRTYSLTR